MDKQSWLRSKFGINFADIWQHIVFILKHEYVRAMEASQVLSWAWTSGSKIRAWCFICRQSNDPIVCVPLEWAHANGVGIRGEVSTSRCFFRSEKNCPISSVSAQSESLCSSMLKLSFWRSQNGRSGYTTACPWKKLSTSNLPCMA